MKLWQPLFIVPSMNNTTINLTTADLRERGTNISRQIHCKRYLTCNTSYKIDFANSWIIDQVYECHVSKHDMLYSDKTEKNLKNCEDIHEDITPLVLNTHPLSVRRPNTFSRSLYLSWSLPFLLSLSLSCSLSFLPSFYPSQCIHS